jgi:hypothetical protein
MDDRPKGWTNPYPTEVEDPGMYSRAELYEAGADAMKAALVDEGWKSGERVNEQLKAWLNEFVTAIKDKDNLLPGRAGKIEGKILDAVREQERTRIVGLFDAEEEQISEQDWTNNSMKRLDAHQRIIEGLRASPTEQTDGK